jgi:uncharacterized OB-fold protein
MLPADVPAPRPTEVDAGFWSACAARELRFQCCEDCERWQHPPASVCAGCGSARLDWAQARGPARVYSASLVHAAAHPSVRQALPYVLAVVEYPDCGGVRLITNIEGPAPAIGEELTLVWEMAGNQPVPRFQSARSSEGASL